MEKTVLTIIITTIISLSWVPSSLAQSPTHKETTPSPTTKQQLNEKLNSQINQLKEKIASRVSELNLVEKRGIIGTVAEVSGNKITLTDVDGKTRFVDVDEITKFSSATNKTFGLSDLTKGTKISVLGLYNKQSKRILARFIRTSVDPVFISGTITQLDSKNFFITIQTPDQKERKLDIQTSTKIFSFDNKDDLARSGFSKLEVGDRISALGFPDKKDANMIVPNRVITYTELPNNPKIKISEIAPTEKLSTTPTTGVKKVTPTP